MNDITIIYIFIGVLFVICLGLFVALLNTISDIDNLKWLLRQRRVLVNPMLRSGAVLLNTQVDALEDKCTALLELLNIEQIDIEVLHKHALKKGKKEVTY